MITVAHFMCACIHHLAWHRNNLRSGVKPPDRQVVVQVLVEYRSSLGSAGWRCAGRGRGLLVHHDHLAVRGVRHWRTGRTETYRPSYGKGDVRPYYVRPSLVGKLVGNGVVWESLVVAMVGIWYKIFCRTPILATHPQ